jgi:hypothetical protein
MKPQIAQMDAQSPFEKPVISSEAVRRPRREIPSRQALDFPVGIPPLAHSVRSLGMTRELRARLRATGEDTAFPYIILCVLLSA